MSDIKASIIISVYKDTHSLSAVLDSLKIQTESHFEIIISEDGCSPEMSIFVQQYNWFCQFRHLTQEDLGWRKNRALNRAVAAAKAPWIIFIDGDCVVHPQFVEMHLKYAAENRVLLGKRVKLSEAVSHDLKNLELSVFDVERLMWKYLLFHHGCRYVDEGICITKYPHKELRKVKNLTGCNFSLSKQSLIKVNGFDEDYIQPAVGEDLDLHWRLKAAGLQMFSVRNRAVMYHLFHKSNWSSQADNVALMNNKIKEGKIFCVNGLNKYL